MNFIVHGEFEMVWYKMLLAAYFVKVLLLSLGFLTEISALRDVRVSIPAAVKALDTVALQCDYDLEGEPLYTVKWYKGAKEFYRYIPKELPNTQVFPLPGLLVDLNKSTYNRVVLKEVRPEVSGRYKCEVSSDAPNFYTFMVSGYMMVIDIPEDDPMLSVEKEILEVGSTFRGNCSSPSSYPPANVTWLINGEEVNSTHVRRFQRSSLSSTTPSSGRRSPAITVANIELDVDESTFRGGKARLSCIANIFDLYNKSRAIDLQEERPKPMLSSVLGTLAADSGSSVNFSINISLVLCLIAFLR